MMVLEVSRRENATRMEAALAEVDEQADSATTDCEIGDYLGKVAVVGCRQGLDFNNDLIFDHKVGNVIAKQRA